MSGLGDWALAWTWPAASLAFVALAVLETHRPRDALTAPGRRWLTNLSLYAVLVGCTLLAAPSRWAGPLLDGWDRGPVAALARHAGPWAALAAGLVLMDGLAYAMHRLAHLPPLWRLHAVHHADEQVDLTTGLRHHPGEALVNMAVGAVVLALLGLPPYVAALYGLIAPVFDLWTHANIALPLRLERPLGWFVVTPAIHRMHHSADPADHDTNFGSILTLWDHVFASWRRPATHRLRFGLHHAPNQTLLHALIAPFHARVVAAERRGRPGLRPAPRQEPSPWTSETKGS